MSRAAVGESDRLLLARVWLKLESDEGPGSVRWITRLERGEVPNCIPNRLERGETPD